MSIVQRCLLFTVLFFFIFLLFFIFFYSSLFFVFFFFFFQAEDGIRDGRVTGVQTCALPIYVGDRLDLVDRHRLPTSLPGVLEPEQPAQRHQPLGLLVDRPGVLLEDVVAAGARGVLQPEDGLGVEEVQLALAAPLILPAHREVAVG